ncbi:MAG: heme oxygenase (biliverdin-producing) [Microbacterium sp.]
MGETAFSQPAAAAEAAAVVTIEQTVGRPLSERLRKVSHLGHRESGEEPKFAVAYLRGGLNREGIAAQAAQHYLMYEALESATLAHRERLGKDFPFWLPELQRLPSLAADLEHWLGANWRRQVDDRFATTGIMTYVARISEVAPTSLPHFVAHHYTRYLADLSGGQMIAKMFRESYDTEGDLGSKFYTFAEIDDLKHYKETYRELVDAQGFSEEEQVVILKEVAVAYWLNGVAGQDLEDRFEEYRAS